MQVVGIIPNQPGTYVFPLLDSNGDYYSSTLTNLSVRACSINGTAESSLTVTITAATYLSDRWKTTLSASDAGNEQIILDIVADEIVGQQIHFNTLLYSAVQAVPAAVGALAPDTGYTILTTLKYLLSKMINDATGDKGTGEIDYEDASGGALFKHTTAVVGDAVTRTKS